MINEKHGERWFDSHKYRRNVRNFETVVLPVLYKIPKNIGIQIKGIRFYDQWDDTNKKCSDVERFSFKLDGAVAFQGYTQMVCTAKDMYREDGVDTQKITTGAPDGSTKKNPAEGTSWGKAGDTRSFAMLRDNASQYGDGMDFNANIVSAPLPQLNVLSEYNEVALTPEK